jgi:hypothetical protein
MPWHQRHLDALVTGVFLALVVLLFLVVLSRASAAACLTPNANGVINGVNNRSDCLVGDRRANLYKPDAGRLSCIMGLCGITDEIRRYVRSQGDAVDVVGPVPNYVSVQVCQYDRELKCVVYSNDGDKKIDAWFTLRDPSGSLRFR